MPPKDPELTRPGTDLLLDTANQVASDRARRINSLHKQVDGLLKEESKKTRQMSAEVGSIAFQQEQLRKQLSLERDEMTSEMAHGYGKVVSGLGNTIKQLSIGMKNISVSTARASSDAISQYGKAIGEDISINKTNTIAMSLAKATPLFGYFAAKFMETDVFRGAVSKIRQSIGGAMLAGLRGAGSAISNIFRGKSTAEKIAGREREIGALSGEIASLKKELQAKPPSLQVGGYVKKGGVVEVHAAEVIAPVDKLVKQIVETTSSVQEKRTQSIFKTFIKEFKMAKDPKQENWQDRMLKAILELKVAFIGTTSRLRVAWQRTLLENPAFRGMLMFAEGFKAVLGAPIAWLFGARGGYMADIKRATATDNVFLKVANVLGLIYTMGMPKLDAIAKYTRATAEFLTGRTIKPPVEDRYTMFQKIGAWVQKVKAKEKGAKGELTGAVKKKFWDMMGVDEDTLKEFEKKGFEGIGELAKEGGGAAVSAAEEAKDLATEKYTEMSDSLRKLLKLKEIQEEREKPKSPSWVDNISSTFQAAKERIKQGIEQQTVTEKMSKGISTLKDKSKQHYDKVRHGAEKQFTEIKKSRKAQEIQNSFLGRMAKRLKRLGSWGWKLLMFGWNLFQGLINTAVNTIGMIFSPLLSALGMRGLFKTGGPGFIATGKKGMKNLGKFGKKTARVQRMAGTRAAGKFVGKSVLGRAGAIVGGAGTTVGRIAGVGLGGVMGVGMGLWDAIRAGQNPEEFAGGWLARGVSGFLGGQETGARGALSGALKLGGIGAAVGSFIPGIGTLIGGAIGAAAGAILGFIGGKKISKAISPIIQPIQDLLTAWWKYISFPFKFIKEMVKLVKFYLTEHPTGKKVWEQVKFWAPKIMFPPLMFIWGIKKAYNIIKGFGQKISDKLAEMKDTWYGKILNNLWLSITAPFRAVGWLVENFGKIYSGIKEWITNFIEKLKKVPFIGKFLKGIKEIDEGTFAEKRIEEYKAKEHFGKVAAAAPGGTLRPFELQKVGVAGSPERREAMMRSAHYARRILGAEEIRFKDGVAHLAKVQGKWYKLKIDNSGLPEEITGVTRETRPIWDYETEEWTTGVRETPIRHELYKQKASKEHLEAMATTISDKLDETGQKANNLTVGQTTVLTNAITNNNSSAVSGGGGGMAAMPANAWGSGHGAATDVTHSNLN